jgi:hypothetical protein
MAAGGGKSNFDCYFLCRSRRSPAGLARPVTRVNRSPGAPPSYVDSTYNSHFRATELTEELFCEIPINRGGSAS